MQRRITQFGDSLSTTGHKCTFIKTLSFKILFFQIIIGLSKALLIDLSIISKMFNYNSSAKEFYSIALLPTNDRNDRVMSQILNTDIGSIDILKQLRAGVPLQSDLLAIVLNMLKCRDEKIF